MKQLFSASFPAVYLGAKTGAGESAGVGVVAGSGGELEAVYQKRELHLI